VLKAREKGPRKYCLLSQVKEYCISCESVCNDRKVDDIFLEVVEPS